MKSRNATSKKTSKKRARSPFPKRILVPVDFSESTEKVIEYAVPLARQFGAKMILMHVVEPMIYPPEAGFVPVDETQVIQSAKRRLRQLAASVKAPRLIAKSAVALGSPYHEICEAAPTLGVGLIIISTHGYTGLQHVFMGSTAERVVRHAPCPVLVLK